MIVGTLGSLVFEVSPEKIETLRSMALTGSSDVSTHSLHGRVGLTEYTGEQPQQFTFSLRSSAFIGADVERTMGLIEQYCSQGTILLFVLGGKRFGRYRWLITKYKEEILNTDLAGTPADSDISITLTEYVKE